MAAAEEAEFQPLKTPQHDILLCSHDDFLEPQPQL